MRTSKTNALTLVEVLIATTAAVAICVLSSIQVAKATERANRNNCLGQLRQVALAMKAYANDDVVNQLFPMLSPRPSNSNELFDKTLVAKEYVKDLKIFRCPSDQFLLPPTGSLTDVGQNSYSSCHGVKDDGGTDTPILADTLLMAKITYSCTEKPPSLQGTGYNVFFSDGHGKFSTARPALIGRLDALYPSGTHVKAAELAASIEESFARRGNFVIVITPLLVIATLGGIVFIVWQLIRARRLSKG